MLPCFVTRCLSFLFHATPASDKVSIFLHYSNTQLILIVLIFVKVATFSQFWCGTYIFDDALTWWQVWHMNIIQKWLSYIEIQVWKAVVNIFQQFHPHIYCQTKSWIFISNLLLVSLTASSFSYSNHDGIDTYNVSSENRSPTRNWMILVVT